MTASCSLEIRIFVVDFQENAKVCILFFTYLFFSPISTLGFVNIFLHMYILTHDLYNTTFILWPWRILSSDWSKGVHYFQISALKCNFSIICNKISVNTSIHYEKCQHVNK